MWHDPLTDTQGLGTIDTRRLDEVDRVHDQRCRAALVPNPVTVDQIVDESLLPVR